MILLLFASTAGAAIFDPAAGWQTIQTEHFRVHHPEAITDIAARASGILEEIYPALTEKWDWRPWNRTEVVLLDNTDDSNGFSSVLPYNWMLIYAAPPQPDSPLAHYDDWLKMLLIHEFTHIVQIDAHGGIWRPMRVLLGKTVAPSGINPTWIREGVAEYDETIFTSGGRGRGSWSEMVVRTAILEDAFPAIDEADGLGWRWPGFRAAYIYGIKFIQYLTDTYGEEKFLAFDRRVRSSVLLSMINHHAKNVYGKSFYALWREWRTSLERRYEAERVEAERHGLTASEALVANARDEQNLAPALSRDGKSMVYTAASPHGKPEIRLMDLASGDVSTLRKGQEATQFSWSPDGTKVAYSAMGGHRRYYRYFDLWLYDLESGKARRLTRGMRARDPDFDPSGGSIIFVASDPKGDAIRRLNLSDGQVSTVVPSAGERTQFANPRISPDGRHIAASAWRPGEGWRIYRHGADGGDAIRLTASSGLGIESRPAWSADGRFVIFSSDEGGTSNIHRARSDGSGAERITNLLTGAFQPTPAPDGTIVAQRYTSKGFEIARFHPSPERPRQIKHKASKGPKSAGERPKPAEAEHISQGEATTLEAGAGTAPGEALAQPPPASKKYVAFGKSLFLPRFIAPNAAYTGDFFFLSLGTGGADVLRWHNWLANGTYRTDAKHVGYSLQYWYNRYRPIFGGAVNDYAVDFGNITFATFDATGALVSQRTVRFFEHRRALSAFFAIPIQRHSLSFAYFNEDHMAKTSLTAEEKAALNLGKFAGLRAEYRYGDAERYPASISLENGRAIRLTTSVTDSVLGSGERNEQVIFSGDWREYVRLWRHHVLALRGAGGITWGDRLVQGTFGLGGALGEGSFGGAGSFNYFPLRGLPVSALSRTRAMLFSGEYRFPIIEPLRGLGTVPIFLKDMSGAIFADYGNAWNAHEGGSDSLRNFFDDFLLGVGAELRGNFIIGHGLPVHGRLGYAIIALNRARLGTLADPILKSSIKNGMLVLTLGTAF